MKKFFKFALCAAAVAAFAACSGNDIDADAKEYARLVKEGKLDSAKMIQDKYKGDDSVKFVEAVTKLAEGEQK